MSNQVIECNAVRTDSIPEGQTVRSDDQLLEKEIEQTLIWLNTNTGINFTDVNTHLEKRLINYLTGVVGVIIALTLLLATVLLHFQISFFTMVALSIFIALSTLAVWCIVGYTATLNKVHNKILENTYMNQAAISRISRTIRNRIQKG